MHRHANQVAGWIGIVVRSWGRTHVIIWLFICIVRGSVSRSRVRVHTTSLTGLPFKGKPVSLWRFEANNLPTFTSVSISFAVETPDPLCHIYHTKCYKGRSSIQRNAPEADLGFYKGGCPLHLSSAKGAEGCEVWAVPPPRKFFVFIISKWWVFMHSLWYLLTLFFSKKAPWTTGRVSGHPGYPWIRPCARNAKYVTDVTKLTELT